MQFKIFVDKTSSDPTPLEILLSDIKSSLKSNIVSLKTYDVSQEEARNEAEKLGLDEIPALLFDKVRISGQINEYFIIAVVAQLITKEGDDRTGSDILIPGDDGNRIKIASSFLIKQANIREETQNFLMMIREKPSQFNPKEIEQLASNGTTVYLLSNFADEKIHKKITRLGMDNNVLIGHIQRSNIHMTLAITMRKSRPFSGSYLRTKTTEKGHVGKWSPLLHDSIKELKNFFIPLFLTSSPVHLDGEIPENETNRLVAKVKDSVEYLKALFY
jgi:hypothetical protein